MMKTALSDHFPKLGPGSHMRCGMLVYGSVNDVIIVSDMLFTTHAKYVGTAWTKRNIVAWKY